MRCDPTLEVIADLNQECLVADCFYVDTLTVGMNLQNKVFLAIGVPAVAGILLYGLWPGASWAGRGLILAVLGGFAGISWLSAKDHTTFDPSTRRIKIFRILRTYEFGFDDVEEVWVPRTGEVRLIVKPGTELSPLLAIHGRRIPIVAVPEGQREVVTQIANVLGAPVRGSYRYRVEDHQAELE